MFKVPCIDYFNIVGNFEQNDFILKQNHWRLMIHTVFKPINTLIFERNMQHKTWVYSWKQTISFYFIMWGLTCNTHHNHKYKHVNHYYVITMVNGVHRLFYEITQWDFFSFFSFFFFFCFGTGDPLFPGVSGMSNLVCVSLVSFSCCITGDLVRDDDLEDISCFLSVSICPSSTCTSSSFSTSCFLRLRISASLSRTALISSGRTSCAWEVCTLVNMILTF